MPEGRSRKSKGSGPVGIAQRNRRPLEPGLLGGRFLSRTKALKVSWSEYRAFGWNHLETQPNREFEAPDPCRYGS